MVPALVLSLLCYNIAGMFVTDEIGAVARTVLETMRTLFVWMVDLLLFYTPLGMGRLGEKWDNYSYLQAVGYAAPPVTHVQPCTLGCFSKCVMLRLFVLLCMLCAIVLSLPVHFHGVNPLDELAACKCCFHKVLWFCVCWCVIGSPGMPQKQTTALSVLSIDHCWHRQQIIQKCWLPTVYLSWVSQAVASAWCLRLYGQLARRQLDVPT